jgi:hypothetical protein
MVYPHSPSRCVAWISNFSPKPSQAQAYFQVFPTPSRSISTNTPDTAGPGSSQKSGRPRDLVADRPVYRVVKETVCSACSSDLVPLLFRLLIAIIVQ